MNGAGICSIYASSGRDSRSLETHLAGSIGDVVPSVNRGLAAFVFGGACFVPTGAPLGPARSGGGEEREPVRVARVFRARTSLCFSAEREDLARGLPTAYAAEPLKSALQSSTDPPPVWPHVDGKVRGYSFAPLYKHAPAAALKDEKLYELLTLVDALRDGRVRERKLAMDELRRRIAPHA